MKKIIWFKKAKCAGSSLEKYLMDKGVIYYYDYNSKIEDLESPENKVICVRSGVDYGVATWVKDKSNKYIKKNLFINHPLLRRVRKAPFDCAEHFVKNHNNFLSENISFAIIRNPFDKFISSWRYLNSIKDEKFEDVVINLPKKKASYHDWLHITKPQYEFVTTKRGFEFVDFYIYMEENFHESLTALLRKIDLNDFVLEHNNKSIRRKVKDEITENQAQYILDIYSKDFSHFGYSESLNIAKPIKSIKTVI